MVHTRTPWKGGARWDSWPLTRLLTLFAAVGLWSYWRFGWSPPSLPDLTRLGIGVFQTLCLLALFSFPAARLFLVVLMFPLYAAIVLHDCFYDGSYWALGLILGTRSPRLSAGLALAGELGLFLGVCSVAEFLVKNYCRW